MKRTLTACAAPIWADATHTIIACEAVFAELGAAPVPFNARADDPELHGKDLWQRLNAGEFGAIGPYVAPPPAPTTPHTTGTQKL